MKFLNTFLIFTIFYNISFSQSDWKDGYVITSENDTLRGQINHLAYKVMGEECRFRNSPHNPVIYYYPKDIQGYVITNFAYYVSREIDDGSFIFLEYLVNGKLDLFYIRSNDKDRYFIQTDTLPLKEIKYEEEIRMVDGVKYFHESKKHIGLIALYTKDAPQLYNRIINIKNDFQNLKKFTVDYHNIVCKDISCITYRNKEWYTKIAIAPYVGQIRQSYFDGNTNQEGNYLAYGFLARIWSPRINKNIFFKTGALISNFDVHTFEREMPTKKKLVVKIPVQFEYVIPTSFLVKPKASLGFLFFTNADIYFAAGVGADIRLSQKINFSLEYDKGIRGIQGIGLGEEYNSSIMAGVYFQI